jgi:hypothetical protein
VYWKLEFSEEEEVVVVEDHPVVGVVVAVDHPEDLVGAAALEARRTEARNMATEATALEAVLFSLEDTATLTEITTLTATTGIKWTDLVTPLTRSV